MKKLLFILLYVFPLLACTYKANVLEPSPTGIKLTVYEGANDLDEQLYYYFPKARVPSGNRVFIFDPNYTAWAVYNEDGLRVKVGKASGGSTYCADLGRPCRTVVGTFKIISKRGPNCRSSLYPLHTGGGAPMPYCMLFASGGYAIHGSNSIPGYNASHGCIRIETAAAKWLHDEFLPIGSTVIVLPYSVRS